MDQTRSEDLRVRVAAPRAAAAGEPVPITLAVENTGSAPATVYLTGRPIAFDIIIERTDGSHVWQRLRGGVIPAILHVRELGPGERLELSTEWDQRTDAGTPVGTGAFLIRGSVPGASEPMTAPAVPLRIDSRTSSPGE